MRQLDEILWSYRHQDAQARGYLLRRLERQPVTVDGAEAATFLQEAEGSDVGDAARLAEDAFYSRLQEDRYRRCGGQGPLEAGDWTRFLGQAEDPTASTMDAADLERAANVGLAQLVPALAEQVKEGGARARAGLKALGRIRVPATLNAIQAASGPGAMAPVCLAAYASYGPGAAPRALDLLKKKAGLPGFESLVLALRGCPTPETFAYLRELLSKGAKYHLCVAAALDGFEDFDVGPLLDEVMTSGSDAWATIHAVETLGRVGGKGVVRKIAAAFRQIEHPIARVVCLQAIANAGLRDGGEVALEALGTKNPIVQAAGVEALIKLPVPTDQYASRVLALLDSAHPKLAMNVALACTLLEPRKGARRVKDLLGSGNPQDILQGVHCLAYMNYPQSAGILATIVHKAPVGPIRVQAVRALGRRAAKDPQSALYLAKLLETTDAQVRRTAAWFLAGAHEAARKGVAGVLAKALQAGGDDAETSAAFSTALALLGPDGKVGVPALEARLERGGDDSTAAAWALAVAFPEADTAAGLSRSRDPVLRAYGALRKWVLGEKALDELAGTLNASDEQAFLKVAEVARQVVELPAFAFSTRRLEGLADQLQKFRQSAAFEGAEQALGILVADEPPAAQPAAGQAADLKSTASRASAAARAREARRSAIGGDELRVKAPEAVAAAAMPSAEEAAVALDAARDASSEDVEDAVRRATYFGAAASQRVNLNQRSGTPPGTPQSSGTQVWAYLQIFVFAAAAIALGRVFRMYLLGVYD